MTRPTLLFLTDLSNGSEDEDILISNFLRHDFRIFVGHPADCEMLEGFVDAIVVRNIWNKNAYGSPEPWYRRWRERPDLPFHDQLYRRQGEGKDYLLELYRSGFPVIPTVDDIRNLDQLPEAETYFIKPKDGFDAIGARAVSRAALLRSRPLHCLIQPFVEFEHEVSFYYLDKRLQYALYAPDKSKRWNLHPFVPSAQDIEFAERFVGSSPQGHGIERVDACRLKSGELLLMELTDQGGAYLSVQDLPAKERLNFLENLSRSIGAIAG